MGLHLGCWGGGGGGGVGGGVGGCNYRPFQASKTVLQLRICGLKHCHVTYGHARDQFFDVHLSFFLEPHSNSSYQTHSYLLE